MAVHSGGLYRVQVDAGHEVLAQLRGRMRRFRIKVVPGDRVTVGISPYDPQRGIITFRARWRARIHLNTNSAHTRRPGRRRPGGRGSRGPAKPFSFRPSAPPPDLPWETVDVDAAPIAFDSMGFDTRLESGFHALGFEGTRPVQGAVIPVALEGHDVVACAETGTGKTLASRRRSSSGC